MYIIIKKGWFLIIFGKNENCNKKIIILKKGKLLFCKPIIIVSWSEVLIFCLYFYIYRKFSTKDWCKLEWCKLYFKKIRMKLNFSVSVLKISVLARIFCNRIVIKSIKRLLLLFHNHFPHTLRKFLAIQKRCRKFLLITYSETLELSRNIEPNCTESNWIEPNRIFSIFLCFFEFGSIEPNS